jgi:hypothetical protein
MSGVCIYSYFIYKHIKPAHGERAAVEPSPLILLFQDNENSA